MKELIKEAISNSKQIIKTSCVENISPVGGGCIHNAWCIHFQNGKKMFAKSNHIDNLNMFKFEFESLSLLKRYANKLYICIPEPLGLITYKNLSIICLAWIDLRQSYQKNLGHGLALIHQSSSKENKKNFGWDKEGFIGTNPQIKGWDNNWGKFFVKYRLNPQLKKAKDWGLNIKDYTSTLSSISLYLNNHQPKVSILHGDLWSGNCATNPEGLGCIFDPASYWGDREVDISMSKLFGGFNDDFYRGYEEVWPLEKSWEKRTEIYNLYHILNHANIFGGSYKQSALKTLKNLRLRFRAKS